MYPLVFICFARRERGPILVEVKLLMHLLSSLLFYLYRIWKWHITNWTHWLFSNLNPAGERKLSHLAIKKSRHSPVLAVYCCAREFLGSEIWGGVSSRICDIKPILERTRQNIIQCQLVARHGRSSEQNNEDTGIRKPSRKDRCWPGSNEWVRYTRGKGGAVFQVGELLHTKANIPHPVRLVKK